MQINSIAIIRLSSLGDVLLTTALPRLLKELHPSAKVTVVTRAENELVYRYHPFVDRLLILHRHNSSSVEIRNCIADAKFDIIIDLQNNFRSAGLIGRAAAKVYRFNKMRLNKLLLVHCKVDLFPENNHISARYASSYPPLSKENRLPELFFPPEYNFSQEFPKNCIALAPGAKHFSKRWQMEKWKKLANKLIEAGYNVCCVGGRADREICSEIATSPVLNFCNDNDLFAVAGNLKQCILAVTNDSALSHVAQAVGTPLVAIFGSTVKSFGFFPVSKNSLLLEVNSLSCRPCTHTGRNNCPKGHFHCMELISPERVFSAIEHLLHPSENQEDW